jgi:hypothetical protein
VVDEAEGKPAICGRAAPNPQELTKTGFLGSGNCSKEHLRVEFNNVGALECGKAANPSPS